MNTAFNSYLIDTIFTVLGFATTWLITEIVSYLKKKKQAEIAKIGVDEYNSRALISKGIFYQVEQIFKLIPSAGTLKATMFDKLLLAKFPTLTQSQLDHFRESVVGEANSQVETLLAPIYDPVVDEANTIVDESLIKTESIPNADATPINQVANVAVNPLAAQ